MTTLPALTPPRDRPGRSFLARASREPAASGSTFFTRTIDRDTFRPWHRWRPRGVHVTGRWSDAGVAMRLRRERMPLGRDPVTLVGGEAEPGPCTRGGITAALRPIARVARDSGESVAARGVTCGRLRED